MVYFRRDRTQTGPEICSTGGFATVFDKGRDGAGRGHWGRAQLYHRSGQAGKWRSGKEKQKLQGKSKEAGKEKSKQKRNKKQIALQKQIRTTLTLRFVRFCKVNLSAFQATKRIKDDGTVCISSHPAPSCRTQWCSVHLVRIAVARAQHDPIPEGHLKCEATSRDVHSKITSWMRLPKLWCFLIKRLLS